MDEYLMAPLGAPCVLKHTYPLESVIIIDTRVWIKSSTANSRIQRQVLTYGPEKKKTCYLSTPVFIYLLFSFLLLLVDLPTQPLCIDEKQWQSKQVRQDSKTKQKARRRTFHTAARKGRGKYKCHWSLWTNRQKETKGEQPAPKEKHKH